MSKDREGSLQIVVLDSYAANEKIVSNTGYDVIHQSLLVML